MPQGPMEGQQPPLYGEPPVGGEEGDPKEGGEGEPGEYPEYEDDDKLIDTFSVKDGGPIPLLQVTMICIFKNNFWNVFYLKSAKTKTQIKLVSI